MFPVQVFVAWRVQLNMHLKSITHAVDWPKPFYAGEACLSRFKQYLNLQGQCWSQSDALSWQELHDTLNPTNENAFLHAWIVHALDTKHCSLPLVAVWCMQYPAGQVLVASRWEQAPHRVMGLLYPDWSKTQHTKATLGLPWYNGIA